VDRRRFVPGRSLQTTRLHPIRVSHGRSRLLEGAVSFRQGQKDSRQSESQEGKANLFQPDWQAPDGNWKWLKKKAPAALMLNRRKAGRSRQREIPISVSASSWATQITCTTASLCLNPPWRSWPRIDCAVFLGESTSGRPFELVSVFGRKNPDQPDRVETSCGAWVYGPFQKHAPRCQVPRERLSLPEWTLKEVRSGSVGQQIYLYPFGKGFSTGWPLWSSFPGCFSG